MCVSDSVIDCNAHPHRGVTDRAAIYRNVLSRIVFDVYHLRKMKPAAPDSEYREEKLLSERLYLAYHGPEMLMFVCPVRWRGQEPLLTRQQNAVEITHDVRPTTVATLGSTAIFLAVLVLSECVACFYYSRKGLTENCQIQL